MLSAVSSGQPPSAQLMMFGSMDEEEMDTVGVVVVVVVKRRHIPCFCVRAGNVKEAQNFSSFSSLSSTYLISLRYQLVLVVN